MLLLTLLACRNKDLPEDTGAFLDRDGDGVAFNEDCDDNDATVFPGADEACDGQDQDCDELVDEGVTATWYADADGDNYGDPEVMTEACEQPASTTADNTDCDDTNSEVFPDAGERCDEVDNDCDGAVDEDVLTTWYADTDGDFHGDPNETLDTCDPPDGYVGVDDDCDDTDPTSFTGANEVCDGADNNCDGEVDEDLLITFYKDGDSDGFGTDATTDACEQPSGYADVDGDCDDSDPAVNPDAEEVCNSVDDDCDDGVDEEVLLTFYRDNDTDGYGDPAATEEGCTPSSGYVDNDEDCDDADDSLNPDTVWTIDYDGDGYGDDDQTYTQSQCTQPAGYVRDTSDCDDGDEDINPDAEEVCDGADNDCDGTSDNDDATDASTWYDDTDGDGYGDSTTTTTACNEPSGYVADDTDCEPGDGTAYPGSTTQETPGDGVDQNCDGNDGCTDLDCDGLADLVLAEHYSGSSYGATVWLYYNDGSGEFDDSDRTALDGYGVWDVESGDVDGDGYQDVVVVNYYNGTTRNIDSYVYYGSASGYSNSNRDDLPGEGALDAELADLDGDGYIDIVLNGHYSQTTGYDTNAYVYYGSASGYSSSNRTTLPAEGGRNVAIEDLDGDSYDDIVICNQYSGSYSIDSFIYWGSSTGFSSTDRTDLPTQGCRHVLAEDLNADGYPDLTFSNYYSGSYSIDSYVYYGSSTGFSSTNREELATVGATDVEAGDFDGDGYTDLAFSGYYAGSWSSNAQTTVYWNGASGFLTSNKTSLGDRGMWDIHASDIDGDGYDDLVGSRYYTGSGYSGNSYLWWGSSSGLSDSDRDSLPTIGSGFANSHDLDGDGFEELLFGGYYSGSWSTLVDSYLYYGPATALGSSNRTDLSTAGVWAAPMVVGD